MAETDTMLRTFVTFDADFSDDSEFNAADEIIRPGGRNVAEALAALLRHRGLSTSAPMQHSFYGWSFAVGAHGEFGFLLQYPGPWLLLSEDQSNHVEKLAHHEILTALHSDLSSDPRFSAVRWYTKEDYDKGAPGAESPGAGGAR